MKNRFSLLLLMFISVGASAQCVINPGAFGPNDYGLIPDSLTNLPVALVGVPYTTDVQIHTDSDTVTALGTLPITQIQVDSIIGLPAGFSCLLNPANGLIAGGGFACAALTGQAVSGQEYGGPNSDGVYPLTAYYTATVNVFSVPIAFPVQLTGYKLNIQSATPVQNTANPVFELSQSTPNPADNEAVFLFTNPSNGNVDFAVYNMLGENVMSTTISATRGENRFTLNTAELPAGVYLYTFRSGNTNVTRRMTVSH